MLIISTHAHNSAHTELLIKEASTHRGTTGLFIQTQEVDVPIINEIKQEGISLAASIEFVASIHYIQQMIVSIVYLAYAVSWQ